jgi:hypothetical protein
MKIKVENHDGFVKDLSSGAIININSTRAEMARKTKVERERQQEEIKELKGEVAEIKELLNKLIEKL